ncbi:VOC family protein [Sinorhizobium meliloti]|uniref:VOC family protein n=1 Tax=Rhizobium meliloti TaxID=382 RepID=UPI003F1607B4
MNISAYSMTFITSEVEAVRSFYDRFFDTWYPFDCGWYVLMRLGKTPDAPELGFMEPRDGAQSFSTGGMLNLIVADVDEMHRRMSAAGETVVIPLADNPWGDRGFGVLDPAGVIVYCHKEIPPSDEFRQFIQRSPADRRGA